MSMSSGVDSAAIGGTQLDDDDPVYFNSEFILFLGLFIILCFLIALIALTAASCIRNININITTIPSNRGRIDGDDDESLPLPAVKLLRSIPKMTYCSNICSSSLDCAICLSEFVVGDEVRVLPLCEHCFHVACIDRWIGSHFTCPSCRQLLLKTTRTTNNNSPLG